jgi:hypothetical protein
MLLSTSGAPALMTNDGGAMLGCHASKGMALASITLLLLLVDCRRVNSPNHPADGGRANPSAAVSPTSSRKPCSAVTTESCAEEELCYFVSGDFGLGTHGPTYASGGDHRCHRSCESVACGSGEHCRSVLLRASDTGGYSARLCFAEGEWDAGNALTVQQ